MADWILEYSPTAKVGIVEHIMKEVSQTIYNIVEYLHFVKIVLAFLSDFLELFY